MSSRKNARIAVFGLFNTRTDLEYAVDQLLAAGFRNDDLSVLLPDFDSTKAFAHERHTKAPEGAALGAAGGGAVGGVLGLLLGIGALAIPGLGPFIAAGPIMTTLAGLGVGGAVGTMSGALIGMGIPEYEAKRYESFVAGGGYLCSVHADDRKWAAHAKDIFSAAGATDIDRRREASAS